MKKGWQIDKRVPIATIVLFAVSVAFNLSVATWWVSKMDSRIALLETDAVLNRLSREKVINLEAEMSGINSLLREIKDTDLRDIKGTLDHMIWDKPKRREK